MIDVFYFYKMPVAVLGLGKSGIATCKALMASEAEVWAWDDNEDARQRARDQGIPLVDLYICNWAELTSLVLSPGIPLTHPKPHPVVEMAQKANCEVICDVELLARAQRDATYVGITGTNGKSTTTTLIGHILRLTGRDVEVGGNLGPAALTLDPLEEGGIYVLEMSSYQLDLTLSITWDVAVLLNISADHLERHGGMDGYIAAKKQIFHRQTEPRSAIIGIDDEYCEKIYEELADIGDQIVVPISGVRRVHGGVYVTDGVLIDDMDGQEIPVCDLRTIPALQGAHNWQNAAAAYAAARALGLGVDEVVEGLRTYPGLVHRQELVATIDGIRFVNDSKATNADAAAKALACYDNIYWIAGGKPKEGGLAGLESFYPRIRRAYLIGEAAEAFGKQLGGAVKARQCGTLDQAVIAAAADAASDRLSDAKKDAAQSPVVLLSPACASFDQYSDFEERGDHFRQIVATLGSQGVA